MNSNKGKAGQFVKGDPRINRNHGPKCADAAAYSMNATNALAKNLPPAEWATIIADKARRGVQWALVLYADLLIEKPAQKHEGDFNAVVRFIYGNGNGEKKD